MDHQEATDALSINMGAALRPSRPPQPSPSPRRQGRQLFVTNPLKTRRSSNNILRLALMLILCSCINNHGAMAATATPASKHGKTTAACTNARLCHLATQSAFSALNARVDSIFAQLYRVLNYVEGIVTIGDGGSVPDSCQITSEDPEFTNNLCGRVVQPASPPSYAYLESTCPTGYLAAIERDCTATSYDELGERIGFRVLLKSGSFGGVSYCHADTQGMAAGSQVHLEMTVQCVDAAAVPQ